MTERDDWQRARVLPVSVVNRLHAAMSWRVDHVRMMLKRRFNKSVVYAHTRSLLVRVPLPPGRRESILNLGSTNRTYLLDRREKLGPIFSAELKNQYCICVADLPMARRLLARHGEHLQPTTIDIASLVPGGFMRQMMGETHRRYRKALVRAVLAEDMAGSRQDIEAIVADSLAEHASAVATHANSPAAFNAALVRMATSLLHRLFFGVEPHTAMSKALLEQYRALGETRMSWHIGDSQREAFAAIRGSLRELASTMHAETRPASVLSRLVQANALDDTLLGNLIYMVEMGRFDIATFFRWLSRYAGVNEETLSLILSEQSHSNNDVSPNSQALPSIAHSFVLETLRQNQSERLIRKTLTDIHFEGWLIPRDSLVHICMWEAHHDSSRFDHPLRFDPNRFVRTPPEAESFSPFGLGQHVCPFANYSVQLGTIFVNTVARLCKPTLINDGPSVLGPNHWDPPADFSVAFARRQLRLVS